MKKLIIFTIILINISSIYFWNFPYISEADFKIYRLTEQALRKQNGIISNSVSGNINTIEKLVRKESNWNQYLESAKAIHKINKEIYSSFQALRDLMFEELSKDFAFKWQTDDIAGHDLRNRLRTVHYQVPNKILFKNKKLSKVVQFVDKQQELILNQIENDSFKRVVRDSMLINTTELVEVFEKVHLQKALTLISNFQNQAKVLDYHISAFLLSEVRQAANKRDFVYESFTPIIHTETPIVKRGEYFEAEIFAVTYSRNPLIKIAVNGREIPVKNGIGIYKTQPNSTGRRKFQVRISETNPLTKKTKTYQKEFIYDVIPKSN